MHLETVWVCCRAVEGQELCLWFGGDSWGKVGSLARAQRMRVLVGIVGEQAGGR